MGSNPTGVRDFFSFSVWAHFLSRAIAQKVLFRIFTLNFNLPHTTITIKELISKRSLNVTRVQHVISNLSCKAVPNSS